MSLTDDLQRIAVAAARFGELAGVVPVEPVGGTRYYVVAFGGDERSWLVLDDAGEPVGRRESPRPRSSTRSAPGPASSSRRSARRARPRSPRR